MKTNNSFNAQSAQTIINELLAEIEPINSVAGTTITTVADIDVRNIPAYFSDEDCEDFNEAVLEMESVSISVRE